MTGATATMMQLQLFDGDGKLLCDMDNNDATLESYPVQNGYRVHVSEIIPFLIHIYGGLSVCTLTLCCVCIGNQQGSNKVQGSV